MTRGDSITTRQAIQSFPTGALAEGSDLAIGSVHKTLTGLGQTSVLSVGSRRIDTERLKLCFELRSSRASRRCSCREVAHGTPWRIRDNGFTVDQGTFTTRRPSMPLKSAGLHV